MSVEVVVFRDCPAQRIPLADPIVIPAGTKVTVVQSLGDWHTVMTERRQLLRVAAADSDALGVEPPVRAKPADPTPGQSSLEEQCLETLKNCYDPEFPVNIVDLGLVYVCQVTPLPDGGHEVLVLLTLTSPGCGMSELIKNEIEEKLTALPGVKRVRAEIVFDPPWDPSRITEAAQLELGLL
jgi:probable FeS assembly SUF system protein SufT